MTTEYKFKAGYTKLGVATAPSAAPTCTVVDSANNLLASAQATTALANMPGVYLYSYTGADGLDLVGMFHTTDTTIDQPDLFSYTSDILTTRLDEAVSAPKNLVAAYDAAKTAAQASDVQAGLTAQGYTAARAGYLDTLNGLVVAIWSYASRTITQISALAAGNVVIYVPSETAKIRYAYCTLGEMGADQGDIGLRDDILERFIVPATQYLLGEIGQFIPTVESRIFAGNSKADLVISPLLTIIAVANDEHTVAPGDYILEPTTRMWQYGPYVKISLDIENLNGAYWVPEKDAVQISATWGLYELVVKCGATIKTTQGETDETLEVSDAGKISAGMVLLVESEIQFLTGFSDPAAAVTSLSVACDTQTETLTVASTANIFPGEIIRIDFERMKVLDKTSSKLNVARGWAGSTKSAHSSSADVDVYKVFTCERAVNGTTAAAHAATTALKRYKVPDDVNYLTRQIATLMMKKSQTGYAGRSGNAETGETFYTFEFPRDAIERVKRNYHIPHMR